MLDIGWGEMLILALLALLVLGPRELPHFLRMLGRFWQRVRMRVFALRQNLSLMDSPEDWLLGEMDDAPKARNKPAASRKPSPHGSPGKKR